MQDNKYDYVVFIGRIQPLHLGHLYVLQKALHVAHRVIVLLGSSNLPPSCHNPWSFVERKNMLLNSLKEELVYRIHILPINDYTYDDQIWIQNVKNSIHSVIRTNDNVALIGMNKDETSYYLKLFPEFKFVAIDYFFKGINATDIRDKYLCKGDIDDSLLPKYVTDFLSEFKCNDTYKLLMNERNLLLEHHNFTSKYNLEAFFCIFHEDKFIVIKSKFQSDLHTLPCSYITDLQDFYECINKEFSYLKQQDLQILHDNAKYLDYIFLSRYRKKYSNIDAVLFYAEIDETLFASILDKNIRYSCISTEKLTVCDFYGDIFFILRKASRLIFHFLQIDDD
ncbi:adenylyltransferase/cytidyltransferase family protein [Anaplasmataceae bacterium AB001_6]|nr:adenylyltransferase/cytidyltransferase family protein [Anaplasmataceae bacterium AB001_6]